MKVQLGNYLDLILHQIQMASHLYFHMFTQDFLLKEEFIYTDERLGR